MASVTCSGKFPPGQPVEVGLTLSASVAACGEVKGEMVGPQSLILGLFGLACGSTLE
jgi:hypothetical protein